MSLHLITAPVTSPVSIHELRAHLRITQDDEDALVAGYAAAAVASLDGRDGWLGRAPW